MKVQRLDEKQLYSRIKGALIGIAYGDAFGMVTEMWTPEQIRERTGRITEFRSGHPENLISSGLQKGEVTDDTLNSIMVIEMLYENHGAVSASLFIEKLKRWIASASKSSTVVGPSTRRAIELIDQGVEMKETGKFGSTNGGAMKILPIGLAAGIRAQRNGFLDEDLLLRETEALCMPTHYTSCAVAAACAIAAGGASALFLDSTEAVLDYMMEMAEKGSVLGNQLCGPSVAARMRMAKYFAVYENEESALRMIYDYTGTGLPSTESIPAAAALFYMADGDAKKCARYTANIGGDTDTMGAMACGICGAFSGAEQFDKEEIELLERVNGISFDRLSCMLIEAI